MTSRAHLAGLLLVTATAAACGAPAPAQPADAAEAAADTAAVDVRVATGPTLLHEIRVPVSMPDPDRSGPWMKVRTAGDVNADGHDDLLVISFAKAALWRGEECIEEYQGAATVWSGMDGSQLWSSTGMDSQGFWIASAAAAGDLNLDGHGDLVVSFRSLDAQSVEVRAISGADWSVLYRWHPDGLSSGRQIDIPLETYGSEVGCAGDLNQDGYPDVFVTGPLLEGDSKHDNLDERLSEERWFHGDGVVDVYSGADGSLMHRWSHMWCENGFGLTVDAAGDVDGDGADDIVVGAPTHWALIHNDHSEGAVFVLSGSDGSVLRQWEGNGEVYNDCLGRFVGGVGDVDGDGFADIVTGEEKHPRPNSLQVRSGRTGTILRTIPSGQAGEGRGTWYMQRVGDVDGDGIDELITGTEILAGTKFVNGDDRHVLVVSPLDGSILARFTGMPEQEWFGCAVGSAGDANGDGRADIAIADAEIDEDGQAWGIIKVYSLAPREQ